MIKKTLLTAICICSAYLSIAQLDKIEDMKKSLSIDNKDTVAWMKGGVLTIGANQGFLHNWAAGGEVASMTINGQFSGYLNRVYHRHLWTNNLDMTYGLFYAFSNHFVPKKIDDRIDFTSKYGFQISKEHNLFFAVLFNFKSQFTKGYDYNIPNWDSFSTSNIFSPAYFTKALGIEYRKENLSLFLSPVATRVTIADKYYTLMYPEGAFGVKHGETSRFELGSYFTGRYTVEMNKRLLFKTRVDLYANYLAKDVKNELGEVVKKDNPGNIDLLWDNFFSWKMNKFLSLTLAATFIYDNDLPYHKTITDPSTGIETKKDEPGEGLGWWQVKQLFSIGFEYRF